MKTYLLTHKNIVAVLLALVTAPIISSAIVRPAFADYQSRVATKHNCAAFIGPKKGEPIDIRVIDPETGLIYVNQPAGGTENVVPLDYKASDADAGCSDDAKFLFQRVREIEKKQIADSCVDFQDILSGKKSNVSSDGRTGNLDAARSFISKYCK